MKIRLPRDLRGFAFSGVSPVELNDFDVELLLPSLFFRVVTEGKDRGRYPNDPEAIDGYVRELASHNDLEGFESESDIRTLKRLLRTSLVHVGFQGRSRKNEKIEGLHGYSILTLKPGFPDQHSRIRRVDMLLYRMLRQRFGSSKAARDFFVEIFGQGVTLDFGLEPDGAYDGSMEIDTLTRLSLSLMDVFKSTGVRNPRERDSSEALPAIAEGIGRDLQRYMKTYSSRMPTEAFTYHLKALINFELFQYSIKLFYSVAALVRNPEVLPAAMTSESTSTPPDLYFDFSPPKSGISNEMARQCVRRDLDAIQRFIPANLKLRQLDRYLDRSVPRRVQQQIDSRINRDEGGPAYLQSLLNLLLEPTIEAHVDARAALDEERIREENLTEGFGQEEEAALDQLIERIVVGGQTQFDRLIMMITEAQTAQVTQNTTRWFRDVAGLDKPYGVLSGSIRSRQGWRYAPSSDLLGTLVQLAAVDYVGWSFENPEPRPISLQDFLIWLEERFGILVNQPPDGLEGAEYSAAAQDNLKWMLRRLKQMGIFRDLSDDFTVQRLTPPYMNPRTEPVQR